MAGVNGSIVWPVSLRAMLLCAQVLAAKAAKRLMALTSAAWSWPIIVPWREKKLWEGVSFFLTRGVGFVGGGGGGRLRTRSGRRVRRRFRRAGLSWLWR